MLLQKGYLVLLSLVHVLQDADAHPPAPEGGGIGGAIGGILYLAFLVAFVAGMWKTFAKAGRPGWAAIVPIYNVITLLGIANKPFWWFLLLGIPVVNIIIMYLVTQEIAKGFGKSAGFGFGLLFLPFVFYPMLGFSDATFQGKPA